MKHLWFSPSFSLKYGSVYILNNKKVGCWYYSSATIIRNAKIVNIVLLLAFFRK